MADTLFPREPADAQRRRLRDLIEARMSLKQVSLAAGLPADYLHRYVYLGLPARLPQEVRGRLAAAAGLGPAGLDPPPGQPAEPPPPAERRLPVWVVASTLAEALNGAAPPCRIETRSRAVPAAIEPTHLCRLGLDGSIGPRGALVVASARVPARVGDAVMVYFATRRLFVPAWVSGQRAGRHALRCAAAGGGGNGGGGGEAWLMHGYRLLKVVEVLPPA